MTNSLWHDDNEELSNRVGELEEQIKEILERMKQMENVLTTAFKTASWVEC